MSDDQSSDEPSPVPPAHAAPDDERVHTRAELLDDERAAGSDDPRRQAEVILADSDLRSADRHAAPSSIVEHRRSDDTVDPT